LSVSAPAGRRVMQGPGMGKMLRERIVKELTRKYAGTEHCVFVDFSGLDVESLGQLRLQLHQQGMELFIAKNSLLRLALEGAGLPMAEELFERPTAVLSGGEDAVAICKLIVNWKKKTATTEIKGGMLERRLLSARDVVDLSNVPPRQVLLSQILGLFVAPLSDIAGLLGGTLAQFANLLNNHVEKMEGKGQQEPI
jgi:large subunit ribosomal protein L10